MATFTITIPNPQVPRVVDALCSIGAYVPVDAQGVANPMTKAEFAKNMIREFIKESVRFYEGGVATKTSQEALTSTISTIRQDVESAGITVG